MNDFTETESQTNNGIIDVVVKTESYIYLFEIKIDKSAEIALDQIRKKEYFQPFLPDDRVIMLVGVNFSTGTRRITDWKTEQYTALQKSL